MEEFDLMAVTLTESAATEVRRLIDGEKLGDDTCLRMAIGGGGCSGMQYGLGFDQEYDPAVDAKYDHHGVSLVTKVVRNRSDGLSAKAAVDDPVVGESKSPATAGDVGRPRSRCNASTAAATSIRG